MPENLILSANPPTISAGVSAAKVNWKVTKTNSGIVPDTVSGVIPFKNAAPKPPAIICPQGVPVPSEKATL